MRVLVIGAGGILGQHLMISVPSGVDPVFTRRKGDGRLYQSLDLLVRDHDWEEDLDSMAPDVVVNLAGESSVDTVEANPTDYYEVNVTAVERLKNWCDANGKHLIHVSSQAVIGPRVNKYGEQKYEAEELVRKGKSWTIVRPTFVLGIRPFPGVGRENPAERILSGKEEVSVCDRFFSVSFAWDVAEFLWQTVTLNQPSHHVLQVGNREPMTRLSVAHSLGVYPKKIKHDSLGIAPRQMDTVYQECWSATTLDSGFQRLEQEFGQRSLDTVHYKAKEVAGFFKQPWGECLTRLQQGFGPLHNAVSEDFRGVFRLDHPPGESDLLDWYRQTESYIWELTAYHCDTGFNYSGMVRGIAEALKTKGAKRVLCLGDGVGSLTIALKNAGLDPFYHDLMDSKTAVFARVRQYMRFPDRVEGFLTGGFFINGLHSTPFDAVVSLDYLEHVPNVEEWVKFIWGDLKPGGLFIAQNAFHIGSGPQGDMPMHLAVNDHYETDWDPLLFSLGFVQLAPQWYQKPE